MEIYYRVYSQVSSKYQCNLPARISSERTFWMIPKLTFKNDAPFRSCILKINKTFVENSQNLDVVIPMCNLLEYSGNYSMTWGRLWNYCRDEVNDSAIQNNSANNYRINNIKITTSNSFEYETKLKYTKW